MPCPRKIAEQKNSSAKFKMMPDEGKPLFETKEPKEKDYRSGVTKNQPER
jgi:hypothetical protein